MTSSFFKPETIYFLGEILKINSILSFLRRTELINLLNKGSKGIGSLLIIPHSSEDNQK